MNYMFSPMPWLGYREAPSDGSLIKADGEHGSYGLAVLCLYSSTLTGYDHARQRKPDPKAFAVGILALIEAFKDVGQILRRNARAAVLNYNFGKQGVFGCLDLNPAALGGVLHAVLHNIADGFATPRKISPESAVRMDEQRLPAQLHGNEQGHTGLFEQLLQTDLLLLELHRAGVQP